MHRITVLLGLIFLLLAVSCKKNTYVIEEDKLVDILTEIHLTEAIIYQDAGRKIRNEDKLAYYNHVYEKYGVTKARVDSSINYYVYYAPEFNDVYNKVIERLEKLNAEVKLGQHLKSTELSFYQLSEFIQQADSLEKDSVISEIWKLNRNISLPSAGKENTIRFSIENDSNTQFDFVVLKADYELFFDDGSQDPAVKLNLIYEDGKESNVQLPLVKNGIETPIRLRIVPEHKNVVRISGELLGHTKCPKGKNAKIRNVRLYKMTQAVDAPDISTQMMDSTQIDSLGTETDSLLKNEAPLNADSLKNQEEVKKEEKKDSLKIKRLVKPLDDFRPVR